MEKTFRLKCGSTITVRRTRTSYADSKTGWDVMVTALEVDEVEQVFAEDSYLSHTALRFFMLDEVLEGLEKGLGWMKKVMELEEEEGE